MFISVNQFYMASLGHPSLFPAERNFRDGDGKNRNNVFNIMGKNPVFYRFFMFFPITYFAFDAGGAHLNHLIGLSPTRRSAEVLGIGLGTRQFRTSGTQRTCMSRMNLPG